MICRSRVRPYDYPLLLLLAIVPSLLIGVRGWADQSEQPEWPFRSPKRPAIPQVQGRQWIRNPIDAFVLAGLEKAELQPNPPADKLTLLRRVTFDLTGLLPTQAQRDAFLADQAP